LSNTGQLVSFKNQNITWSANVPPAQQFAPLHQQQAAHPVQPPYINRPQQPPAAYRPPQPAPMQPNKRVKVEDEEEEETFTPRDVAAQRFVRWTEWMEEVLSSGYNIRISQLIVLV
jgi:Fungal domain of unknown function (DUF1750)